MRAKYPGTCYGCSDPIEIGNEIAWYGNGEVYHKDCAPRAADKPRAAQEDDDTDAFAHLWEATNHVS